MEERIYIIVAKMLHGEAGEAERRELDAWLAQDVTRAGMVAEMEAAWKGADLLFGEPQFDTAAAWGKVAARMAPEQAEPARGKTIALPGWIRYSAAIAAVLLIAFLVYNPFAAEQVRIAATAGDQRLELPDHSIVTLRKGSSFAYPKKFAARERLVSLEGEAYFEVTRDEARPFLIDAQPVRVRVLGTTFNVRCGHSAADVAVTSGRVEVRPGEGRERGKAVVLVPGKKAHYEAGRMEEGPASGYESNWKGGPLSFSNEPLSRVIRAIAEVKDTAIQISPRFTAQQLAQPVTALFRDQGLEDMLTEICLITNCRWERHGSTYLMQPK